LEAKRKEILGGMKGDDGDGGHEEEEDQML